MATCTHPADKASTETLLTTCPDCGAECSGAHVGDDGLCYDERCPLHAMEGETIDPEAEGYILSAGDEFLPPFARAVRDGGAATPEYRAWLAAQVAEMSRDADPSSRET